MSASIRFMAQGYAADAPLAFRFLREIPGADATLTAWLPSMSKPYWDRYQHQLAILAVLARGTWAGLAVPNYVPIDDISQLDAHAARFEHRIVGIEPGVGVMLNTRRAMQVYGLRHMRLMSSSTAAMQALCARAVARHGWVVATAWKPLAMWAHLPMKALRDPAHVYGEGDDIVTVAHPSLQARNPVAWEFLCRFRLPLDEMQSMMADLQQGQSIALIVQNWMRTHPTVR